MLPPSRALLAAVLAPTLAACHRTTNAPRPTVAVAVAAPPPATGPAPAPAVDVCERVAEAQRTLRAAIPTPPEGTEIPDDFAACIPTPHGAWSLEFDSLRVTDSGSWRGHWSVAHYDGAGRRVAIALTQPGDERAEDLTPAADNLDVSPPYSALRPNTETFDYDGDGEPELALVLTLGQNEAEDPVRGRVWTFRDGAIAAFAPAINVEVTNIEDVDRDGRPDLLTPIPFSTTAEAPGSGFTYAIDGPMWVFHSLAGGAFSSTDTVAVGAARTACPSAPGRALRTPTEVACARAWSLPIAAVRAAITRGCRRPVSGASGDPCTEVEAMNTFAPLDAPTHLGPATAGTP